jgi:hypothetical protein
MYSAKNGRTGKKQAKKPKKILLGIGGLIVLAAIAIFILDLTGVTHIFYTKHVPAVIPATNTSSKTAATSKKSTTSASANDSLSAPASQPSDKQTVAGSGVPTSTQALAQPYGTFVSNHTPGQHGSDGSELSTCITTSGATCYIQFTNTSSNVTTKLSPQVTGSDGSTSWSWNVSTLSGGSWKITAVATLNGQTQTANDGDTLVVQ